MRARAVNRCKYVFELRGRYFIGKCERFFYPVIFRQVIYPCLEAVAARGGSAEFGGLFGVSVFKIETSASLLLEDL